MHQNKTRKMILTAFTGAAMIVIAKLFRFPVIPAAPSLKMDFGDVPMQVLALFGGGGMAFGALVIKELLSVFVFGTVIFGPAGDFFTAAPFLLVFSLVWKRRGGFRRLWAALIAGALARAAACVPVNLVILPMQYGMTRTAVLAMMPQIIPFNIIKCLVCGLITTLLYPGLRAYFRRQGAGNSGWPS